MRDIVFIWSVCCEKCGTWAPLKQCVDVLTPDDNEAWWCKDCAATLEQDHEPEAWK